MKKTICSVFFKDCVASRPYKPRDRERGYNTRFVLPAAPRDGFTILKVEEMDELQNLGSDIEPFAAQVPADHIARDIMLEWSGNVAGNEFGGPGIFICAGDEPTPEELKRARHVQTIWCKWLCNIAQSEWVQGNRNNVKDLHRAAAKWLGTEQFEWIKEPEQASLKKCPLCSTQIEAPGGQLPGVCPACRNIINPALFYRFQAQAKVVQAEIERESAALPVTPAPAPEPELAANPQ